MKRLIALLLCILCVLISLVACVSDMPDNAITPDTTPTPEETPVTEKAYIMKMKNGAKGVVTIVHDDGDLKTAEFLNKEFEKYDLRGTIGMIANRVISVQGVKDIAAIQSWQTYLDTGRFDIACHSYTHAFWGITDQAESGVYINNSGVETPFSFGDGNITFETKGARDALRGCFPGQRVLAFVKPGFGKYIDENGKTKQVSDIAQSILKENFIGYRTGGTSTQTWLAEDYYGLTSYQVSLNHTLSQWTAQIDAATTQGRWIIFMFHNIIPDNTVTSSTSTLRVRQSTASGLMEYIGSKTATGELWCAFLEEAILYSREVKSAKGTVATYSDRIEVSLTHKLDSETFNYALTVRVKVPAEWTSVVLTHPDGVTETLTPFVEKDVTYVYANVVPNGTVAVLQNAK